jgi:hypothetical protein
MLQKPLIVNLKNLRVKLKEVLSILNDKRIVKEWAYKARKQEVIIYLAEQVELSLLLAELTDSSKTAYDEMSYGKNNTKGGD